MGAEAQVSPPQRPSEQNNPTIDHSISGGGEAGIIVGVIIILAILGFIAWVLYSRLRARRLGIPPAPLNPFSDRNRVGGSRSGGILGWVREKIGSAQRQRTAGGAYEGTSGPGGGGGGGFGAGGGRSGARSQRAFGGLDPDEAWDARVGTEADGYGYEEQELSLRGMPARDDEDGLGYGGSKYGRLGSTAQGMDGQGGRGRRSELDARYDEEMGHQPGASRNPFDDAEASNMSLREVSPMRHSSDSTGTVERKSAFREQI